MQIHQIIMNLCTNAYHAMREDGGILEVSIDKVTLEGVYRLDKAIVKPEKNYVRLIVKDTGKGMSSDVKERIFEPYYTTKEVGEGTGMGLSIVHGIIKSHNGTIKVDSSPGMGTTFEICFPQIDSEADEKIIRDEIVPTGNERIMLVDDDTMVIAMVEKMLNKLGYSVSAWTNSLDALSSFRQHPYQYDLVLSDMTMPNMTGKQLTQKILEERPDMPVILCTGFSDMIDEEKAKAIGAKELITKPISINVLGTTIRNAIDQSKEKSQKQSE